MCVKDGAQLLRQALELLKLIEAFKLSPLQSIGDDHYSKGTDSDLYNILLKLCIFTIILLK